MAIDVYDEAIRMRMAGMTYAEMARAMGLSAATGAQRRYREARARQIPPEFQPRPFPRPSETVIAWAAGFLDGEGCIFGYATKEGTRGRFRFGVVVAQAVEAPLVELQTLWGGAIRNVPPQKAHYRPQWRWSISGHEAAVFLEDVLPHLRVKFESARVAIPCLYRIHARKDRFSADEIAERRAAVAFLRAANSRGEGVV